MTEYDSMILQAEGLRCELVVAYETSRHEELKDDRWWRRVHPQHSCQAVSVYTHKDLETTAMTYLLINIEDKPRSQARSSKPQVRRQGVHDHRSVTSFHRPVPPAGPHT